MAINENMYNDEAADVRPPTTDESAAAILHELMGTISRLGTTPFSGAFMVKYSAWYENNFIRPYRYEKRCIGIMCLIEDAYKVLKLSIDNMPIDMVTLVRFQKEKNPSYPIEEALDHIKCGIESQMDQIQLLHLQLKIDMAKDNCQPLEEHKLLITDNFLITKLASLRETYTKRLTDIENVLNSETLN